MGQGPNTRSPGFAIGSTRLQLMRAVARLIPLLAATAATALISLDGVDALSLSRRWLVGLILVLAAVSFGEGVERIARAQRRDGRLRQNRRVAETLQGLLVEVVDRADVDWTSIGVHAFLVERQYWLFGPERLRRIGRERLRSSPPPARITWTKGKGAVGRCWELGQDVGMELHPDHLTEDQWNALPADQRLGMTFDDYERTRHFRVVVATPILDRNDRVIGIVSIDSVNSDFAKLWQDAVRDAMGGAATTIRNLYE
jgi:hypothetical protein